MASISFTAPNSAQSSLDLLKLQRQQRIAEALMAKGADGGGQTQMVGGIAVPQSPLEGAGRAAQQILGAYLVSKGDRKQSDLIYGAENARRAGFGLPALSAPADESGGGLFGGIFGGGDSSPSPATPQALGAALSPQDMTAPIAGAASAQPAGSPGMVLPGLDPQLAYSLYTQAPDAYTKSYLDSFTPTDAAKRGRELGYNTPQQRAYDMASRSKDAGLSGGAILQAAPDGSLSAGVIPGALDSTMALEGAKQRAQTANTIYTGQSVNGLEGVPVTGQTILDNQPGAQQPAPLPQNIPNTPMAANPLTSLEDPIDMLQRTAPQNGGVNFGKDPALGAANETNLKGQAEALNTSFADAKNAKDALVSANDARTALAGGAFTGTFAQTKLNVAKYAQAFGLAPDDLAKVSNTEEFKATMGRQVLGLVKGLGAGSGISNADRDFAERVAGGNIDLNNASIGRLLDISDRANTARISQHNTSFEQAKKGGLRNLYDMSVEAPTFGQPAAPSATNSSLRRYNPATGKIE